MKFKIGFKTEDSSKKDEKELTVTEKTQQNGIKPSLVDVYFPERDLKLSYYNDRFDLHDGDRVYVEGKLEGIQGYIKDVRYDFKIKLSQYKRVTALVDTKLRGVFHPANSHILTFDKDALPREKALLWYKAPDNSDEVYVKGNSGKSFGLDNLKDMGISYEVAERGYDYYSENRVVYITLDGNEGYAIIRGKMAYEVEFKYDGEEISDVYCSCFCSYNCKHMFAAMLQLKDILETLKNNYEAEYRECGYFAAVSIIDFFGLGINGMKNGSIILRGE